MYVGKRKTEEMLIDDFEFYILYYVFPFQITTRMINAQTSFYIFFVCDDNYLKVNFI